MKSGFLLVIITHLSKKGVKLGKKIVLCLLCNPFGLCALLVAAPAVVRSRVHSSPRSETGACPFRPADWRAERRGREEGEGGADEWQINDRTLRTCPLNTGCPVRETDLSFRTEVAASAFKPRPMFKL